MALGAVRIVGTVDAARERGKHVLTGAKAGIELERIPRAPLLNLLTDRKHRAHGERGHLDFAGTV
jgi:hypothetical protein